MEIKELIGRDEIKKVHINISLRLLRAMVLTVWMRICVMQRQRPIGTTDPAR